MSLSPYISNLYPGIARGVVDISAAEAGVKVIQTELKDPMKAVVAQVATAKAANEESKVLAEWAGGPTAPTDLAVGEIRFTVTKGGTNDGDAADSAVSVSFIAHAER